MTTSSKPVPAIVEGFQKIDVWRAATGDKSRLLKLLRSGEPLSQGAREQLALLLEGKLVPKRKRRGRPLPEMSVSAAVTARVLSPLQRAVSAYFDEMARLRALGTFYGKSSDVVERVSAEYGVTATALADAVRKGRRKLSIAQREYDEAAEFRRWVGDLEATRKIPPNKWRLRPDF